MDHHGNQSTVPTAAAERSVALRLEQSNIAESKGQMVEAVMMEHDLGETEHFNAIQKRKFWWVAMPSWLISLIVHVVLIFILAAISLDPVQTVISILQAGRTNAAEVIEQFDLQAPSVALNLQAQDEPLAMPPSVVSQEVRLPQFTPTLTELTTSVDSLDMNSLTESILPSSVLSSSVAVAQMSTSLNSRSAFQKNSMLERFGGTAASEKAVAMALKWLADHQIKTTGGWTFAHSIACRGQCAEAGDLVTATNAATAMAILPFLGAGQTHMEGQYQETVKSGLAFLIKKMDLARTSGLPTGSWHEPGGRMYSHGLAAIAVCEAFAMTGDPDLAQPAQLSLNYLIYSQDKVGGGWRYEPGQPGDTSVVGWALMALKSGKMGTLAVPPSTFQGANRFLDFVSTNNGAYYGYDKPTAELDGRQATIAVGLLCRMYLGWPKESPGIVEGVEFLSGKGPSTKDLYYSYYATQVMRHYGGPMWEKWNDQLRDALLASQQQSGHAAGSWYIDNGRHGDKGGRLYLTSLATMILEVYYRHMPLYGEKSSADDFEI